MIYFITPIGSVFSQVKLELQQLERSNTTNTDVMLLEAFSSITPENCEKMMHETGIRKHISNHLHTFNNTGMHILHLSKKVYEVMTKCFPSVQ